VGLIVCVKSSLDFSEIVVTLPTGKNLWDPRCYPSWFLLSIIFHHLLSTTFDLSKFARVIICGDFNAYHGMWGSKCTNGNGRAVVDVKNGNFSNADWLQFSSYWTKHWVQYLFLWSTPTVWNQCSWGRTGSRSSIKGSSVKLLYHGGINSDIAVRNKKQAFNRMKCDIIIFKRCRAKAWESFPKLKLHLGNNIALHLRPIGK